MSAATSSTATSHRSYRGRRRWAAIAAVAAIASVTAAGCGSDSDGASSSSDKATTTEAPTDTAAPASGAEPTKVEATLTDSAIEGLPDDLEAGVVEVAVTDETTDEGAGGELNFSLVADGTTEEDFAEGISSVFEGGPFPEFMQNTAGAIGDATITLDEGSYIVWTDKSSNLDRESTQDDLVMSSLTVGPGTDGAALPESDGSVTASDYRFDVDIPAGEATITFTNESEKQYHHVILTDFGSNDPELVADNLLAIIESDGEGEMPEGIDPEQMEFGVGQTSVFGPGSSGSFTTDLKAGNTYAAICFISDVEGGAPHAMQHEMFEVFTAS
ncbi:hypothetical protein ACE2AJ_09645 [Aquihabitans daechungensis]|uniref:hypothetical protein n=1 Tax=Aquihabitans daechungensis TaxID=1052257 RepID=UPI003B9EFB2C